MDSTFFEGKKIDPTSGRTVLSVLNRTHSNHDPDVASSLCAWSFSYLQVSNETGPNILFLSYYAYSWHAMDNECLRRRGHYLCVLSYSSQNTSHHGFIWSSHLPNALQGKAGIISTVNEKLELWDFLRVQQCSKWKTWASNPHLTIKFIPFIF